MTPEYLAVSGDIPRTKATDVVFYSVVSKASGKVVAKFPLPGGGDARKFSIAVEVPDKIDEYEVGTVADDGAFRPAGFTVQPAGRVRSVGAVG